jgi:sulfur-oxidizing protein SoxA
MMMYIPTDKMSHCAVILKALWVMSAAILANCWLAMPAWATPDADATWLREYYQSRFPDVRLDDLKYGVYVIDEDARLSWQSLEEFPPYADQIKRGQVLYETPFANGNTYASCFPNGGIGIRQNFPYFDTATGEVKTLEQEINECRNRNGEAPLDWRKGDMASITAHMANTSKGKPLNIKIPDDPRALAWYELGKQIYYTRYGQYNMSCANCHIDHVGKRMRGPVLPPALGQPARFPLFRGAWKELGTLHWRYEDCIQAIRGKPFAPQSREFRALEYYQTYLANGITIDAPASSR